MEKEERRRPVYQMRKVRRGENGESTDIREVKKERERGIP